MKKFYRNGTIISDRRIIEGQGILTEDGKILALTETPPADAEVIDLRGAYIAPGFIDLHCHGGDGAEFIDGTVDAIRKACALHAKGGTRVLYPTISATDYDTMFKALEALEAVQKDLPLEVPGVHLEGPYLSPEMCGAQDPGIVRMPDEKEYTALYERFGHLIARWDYAPENDPQNKFTNFLREKGIVASTAHSAAVYEDMLRALEGGNRLVTHLYSCTSTITRKDGFRQLGVIETAFLKEDILAEIIGDGCHLPAELLQMIYQIMGPERLCIITDAIRFGGCDPNAGDLNYNGKIPYVVEDGVAKLADRSAFAGSIATTQRLLQSCLKAGLPLEDVIYMMTATPAKAMTLANKGRIAPGYDAQFTVFDREYRVINL